jgi:hypothetical protein
MFITFLRVVRTVKRSRFLRRIVSVFSFSTGVVQIQDVIIYVSNPTFPVSLRAIEGFKGTCCTAALITSYLAKHTSNLELAESFRNWCIVFTALYIVTGGGTIKGLVFILNSMRIHKKKF